MGATIALAGTLLLVFICGGLFSLGMALLAKYKIVSIILFSITGIVSIPVLVMAGIIMYNVCSPLIEPVIDPLIDGPLNTAILKENYVKASALIKKGCDVNRKRRNVTPLYIACGRNNYVLAKQLIEAGADVNARNNNETALCEVTLHGYDDLISLLIENGADVTICNGFNTSPLINCASRGDTDGVKLLINAGAVINAGDNNGSTALMEIVSARVSMEKSRYIAMTELLLKNGADVNSCNHRGETALMMAARYNCFEVVKILVEHGADINAADLKRKTALIWICEDLFYQNSTVNQETVLYLLHGNRTVANKDVNGKTALDYMNERIEGIKNVIEIYHKESDKKILENYQIIKELVG